jgi:urea transporter/murein DD-endopeptidase MepM/ murein hydrolase activator NlpD
VISFLNPNLGAAGLVSILTSFVFARFVGYEKEFLKSGYYTYNALLVGFSIGQIFTLSPLSLVYLCIAAVITFMANIAISDIFSKYLSLPILSLPFVIVTSLIYLSASKFSNLYVNDLYSAGHIEFLSNTFPYWINGLLKSLGAIVFMPDPIIGLIILFLLVIQSRVLFTLAITGYYFGTFLQGSFIGSYINVFYDLNAFNYPLIAMALGGIFNIPSIKSYAFAFTGVAMSTVLIKSIDIIWAEYGIPVFTLPFLLVTLGFNYVLNLLQYKFKTVVYKNTPEETAEYYYTQQFRYSQSIPMYLPFKDKWSVYQGFDGEWTHQGIWKYAYDFVKRNDKGLTYENEGKLLEDYYCYRKPVTSPCRGIVAYAVDYFQDNPIGVVDTINNWGNYVIIADHRGYYVGVCHLAQGSLLVKAGDWVDTFQQIGLCGNSGYSPQPHIHMQYQASTYLNSVTIPFSFTGLESNKEIFHHHLPEVGENIKPYFLNDFYFQVTNFVLDEVLKFKAFDKNGFVEDVEFKVKMALDSTFYLERNNGKLFFGKSYSSFYFYHLEGEDKYLKLLYQAMPSLPLSFVDGKIWSDVIPRKFLGDFKQRAILSIKALLNFSTEKNAKYEFDSDITIKGRINGYSASDHIKTSITLDPYVKFKEINVGSIKLKTI